MKRLLLILVTISLVFSSFGFAQDKPVVLTTLLPKDPEIMGMGGAFVANPVGFNALLTNPAGFALGKGQLTLVDTSVWAYLRPSTENINAIQEKVSGEKPDFIGIANALITDNGTGGGEFLGLGFVGSNIGLGVYEVMDLTLAGKNLLGATGKFDSQIGAVVGFALPIAIGPIQLAVGGDLRPYLRVSGKIDSTNMSILFAGGDPDFMAMVNDINTNVGFSLALDFGATVKLGPLTGAVTLRDVTTPFSYQKVKLGAIIDDPNAVFSKALDTDSSVSVWSIPQITLGGMFAPSFGILDNLIKPRVLFDLSDPISVFMGDKSPWQLLRLGADAELLRFITVRAGLNSGYLSVGAGLKLAILSVNAAIFTEETGIRAGDKPRTGVSLDAAIRF